MGGAIDWKKNICGRLLRFTWCPDFTKYSVAFSLHQSYYFDGKVFQQKCKRILGKVFIGYFNLRTVPC